MSSNYVFYRRSAFIRDQLPIWRRIRAAYSGGARYVRKALVKHRSELPEEFQERLELCHYFNYPRRIARQISQFIYADEPQRDGADNGLVADWSRSGLSATEVMTQFATIINCYGFGGLLCDMPSVSGAVDEETKQKRRLRPYVRALTPFEIPDWCFGSDGKLDWAIIEEHAVNKSDPHTEPKKILRRRLWTRTEWFLYESSSESEYAGKLVARARHNLGEVPVVLGEEADGFGMGAANHWFEDVVRVSDAILNAESEAQMNIRKQMYGQLVVSESYARHAGDAVDDAELSPEKKNKEMAARLGRSYALWETETEKGLTRYIQPDGATTAEIRAEIRNLKEELFDVVGLAMQSKSREAQSAESKAWDSHNVQQFLSARATMLEQAEQRAWHFMTLWDKSIRMPEVSYNHEFSVVELSGAVAALMDLSSFNAGETYRKETMVTALNLLDRIHRISPAKFQQILKDIEKSEPPKPGYPGMNVDRIGKNSNKGDGNEDQ